MDHVLSDNDNISLHNTLPKCFIGPPGQLLEKNYDGKLNLYEVGINDVMVGPPRISNEFIYGLTIHSQQMNQGPVARFAAHPLFDRNLIRLFFKFE